MGKLNLKIAKDALGISSFVEKTIKFRDANGEEFEGEILIKIATHDEVVNAIDVYSLKDRATATMDQLRKAILYLCVYESEKKKFFSNVAEVGQVSSEILAVMYDACDEVLDFSGKNWISNQATSSGVNSSSTELAEEQ